MKINSVFDLYECAVRLREIHATMKAFYGAEKFAVLVQETEPWLKKLAVFHDGSYTAAAVDAAKSCPVEMTASLILAVAVEMKLRENAETMLAARS